MFRDWRIGGGTVVCLMFSNQSLNAEGAVSFCLERDLGRRRFAEGATDAIVTTHLKRTLMAFFP
jgi:hypothetical protein